MLFRFGPDACSHNFYPNVSGLLSVENNKVAVTEHPALPVAWLMPFLLFTESKP